MILSDQLHVLLQHQPPLLHLLLVEVEQLLGGEGGEGGGVRELPLELVMERVELSVPDHAVVHPVDVETVTSVGLGPGVTQLLSLGDGEMHPGCSVTHHTGRDNVSEKESELVIS